MTKKKCSECGKKVLKSKMALINCKDVCQDCYYELRGSKRPKPRDYSRHSYKLENMSLKWHYI